MFSSIWKVVTEIVPEIVDLFEKGVAGEDITHHWLMEKAPKNLKTVMLDAIKTEQRRKAGLPT